MPINIIEKGYREAEKIGQDCLHLLGTKASALASGYPQIWARDSIISSFGFSLIENEKFQQSFKKSLETLALFQTELGCIPNNVDIKTKEVDTRATMDGNSLYVIGHYVFYQRYKDLDFLKKYYSNIQGALLWLRYQDSDNCGLVEMQEATDWRDLFVTRGNGFYVNVLFSQALLYGAEIAKLCGAKEDACLYKNLGQEVKNKINQRFWLNGKPWLKNQSFMKKTIGEEWWHFAYTKASVTIRHLPFYLSYIGFHDYGDWFDAFGNLLAILFGVADKGKANTILDYISTAGINIPYPVKAIYPTQRAGYKDWREYYKTNNLNLPHQYQNGGIWPFLGGFYVAALVKAGRIEEAKEQLAKLAEANRLGNKRKWEFNEWLHGRYGLPMGVEQQAWSAGMYIYAYKTLKNKKLIYF